MSTANTKDADEPQRSQSAQLRADSYDPAHLPPVSEMRAESFEVLEPQRRADTWLTQTQATLPSGAGTYISYHAATFDPAPAPQSPLMRWATNLTLLALLWGTMLVILKPKCDGVEACPQHPALPGGAVFDILEVLVVGFLGGTMVGHTGLPPLLGMLIAGYVLQNVIPNQLTGISPSTNSSLRNMALAVIMLRAGMGLSLDKLRANAAVTLLLSSLPCLVEAATVAFIAKLLFPVLSAPFALMLGFVLADVSPAVTTPILLDFMSQGLGVDQGIPSILLAAGSVNGVIAIVSYSIVNEFAWAASVSTDKLLQIIGLKFFVQILGVGVVAGCIIGRLLELGWRITPDASKRFFMTFLVAMLIIFGFKQIEMDGGGTLAVITCGATLQHTIKNKEIIQPVSDLMARFWQLIGSVLLFTLLGASIDQSKLEARNLALGVATIAVGLSLRCLAVFGVANCMRGLALKERAFIVVAQCPKATVQAALATVALDYVTRLINQGTYDRDSQDVQDKIAAANVILTTAVLSIIMTAPLFAVLMVLTGNRWLQRTAPLIKTVLPRDWTVTPTGTFHGSVVGSEHAIIPM